MSSREMNYAGLINTLRLVHEQAQAGAAGAVNRYLILRNWLIGFYLVEFEQKGKDRAAYGAGLLKRVAGDLKERGIPGCAVRMLERMRIFCMTYPQLKEAFSSPMVTDSFNGIMLNGLEISSPSVTKSTKGAKTVPRPFSIQQLFRFSWTHFIELTGIEDKWKRAFYENECLKGNWSKRQLQRQIGLLLYERTGLSTDKKAVIESAREQAVSTAESIMDLIRDPYALEFTGLAELPRYHESTLEVALPKAEEIQRLIENDRACWEQKQTGAKNRFGKEVKR